MALGHELASVLAGGLSPLIATALLAWADGWWPDVGYLAVIGAITVVAVAVSHETAACDLTTIGAR